MAVKFGKLVLAGKAHADLGDLHRYLRMLLPSVDRIACCSTCGTLPCFAVHGPSQIHLDPKGIIW
jgi:hypothetical protein